MPAGGEVVGVHEQLVPRPALGEPLGVVHPGVVVALVPAADQQQLVRRAARSRPRRAGPGRRAPAPARRRSAWSSVSSRSGRPGSQRAEVDAGRVWRSWRDATARPCRCAAAGRSVRVGLRAAAGPGSRAASCSGGLRLQPRHGAQRELAEDLPVVPLRRRPSRRRAGVNRAVLRTASAWKTRS